MLVSVDPSHALTAVSKTSPAATNQKALTQWARLHDPQRTSDLSQQPAHCIS